MGIHSFSKLMAPQRLASSRVAALSSRGASTTLAANRVAGSSALGV